MQTHLPGYVADREKLKEAGAEVVVCVAVNDPFVMAAWGEAHCAGGKVVMLADTRVSAADVWRGGDGKMGCPAQGSPAFSA